MKNKEARYQRLYQQFEKLRSNDGDRLSRMATMVALVYHKIPYFFWCGFYLLKDNNLLVSVYQGPLACQKLEKDKGVCWAAITQQKTLIVNDVEKFPGHIACDSRSKSEIVLPFYDSKKNIIGVLDVDSDKTASFDEVDARYLEKMLELI